MSTRSLTAVQFIFVIILRVLSFSREVDITPNISPVSDFFRFCGSWTNNICHYYFHYYPENVTWRKAFDTCRNKNASLVCYNNEDFHSIRRNLIDQLKITNPETWVLERRCSNRSFDDIVSHNQCFIWSDEALFHTNLHKIKASYGENPPGLFVKRDCFSSTAPFICNTTLVEDDPDKTTTCPPVEARGLNWPESVTSDEPVKVLCPSGKGFAKWYCRQSSWYPADPDLSECVSETVDTIISNINETNFEETLSELEQVTGTSDTLTGGDIVAVLEAIKTIQVIIKSEIPEDWKKDDGAEKVLHSTLGCSDNLLKLNEEWRDIPAESRSEVITTLFETVDNAANIIDTDTVFSVSKENLAFQTFKIDEEKLETNDFVIPLEDETGISKERGTGNIAFPAGLNIDFNSTMKVVFSIYKDLRNMLLAHPDTFSMPGEELYDEWGNKTLNSAVTSVSFIANNSSISLNETIVQITLKHLAASSDKAGACVFWNITEKQWDSNGCSLFESNETHSICICNHTTNFAVLMDVQGSLDGLPTIHVALLTGITIVGCTISILCLGITIGVFTFYAALRNMRGTIHCNLCANLLISELILLVGIDRTENETACAVVAGLLHYFFLAAFSWMLLEAVHIYILCIKVFEFGRSYKNWFYIAGYGIPLIIVCLSAALRHEGYGTKQYCWLSNEQELIWSFVGPVAVILLINICAVIIALTKTNQLAVNKNRDVTETVIYWIRNTIILCPILGLTWCLGFLQFTGATVTWAYIFALFNCLQGLFIFILYCCYEKRARNLILGSLRKHKPRVFVTSSVLTSTRSTRLSLSIEKFPVISRSRSISMSFNETHWHLAEDEACSLRHFRSLTS